MVLWSIPNSGSLIFEKTTSLDLSKRGKPQKHGKEQLNRCQLATPTSKAIKPHLFQAGARTHTHTHTHTSSNQEVKNKQGNADGLHPKSLFFFHVLPRVMSIFQGQSPKTDGYMCVPFSVPASTANPNRPVDHDLRPSCGM